MIEVTLAEYCTIKLAVFESAAYERNVPERRFAEIAIFKRAVIEIAIGEYRFLQTDFNKMRLPDFLIAKSFTI